MAELLRNREEGADAIRLEVYMAISATSLYVGEQNFPFTSDPYRVGRGELAASDYSCSIRGRPKCCADTGAEAKWHRIIREMHTEDERVDLETKLSLVLEIAKDFQSCKTGPRNSFVGGLFSISRTLGVGIRYV